MGDSATDTGGRSGWRQLASLATLRAEGKQVVRHGPHQVLLVPAADGTGVNAVANRCPHEGFPLSQGEVGRDAEGAEVVTCHWHNWKFRLGNGVCVQGEDDVRRYPTRVDGDTVWVDLSPPGAEAVLASGLRGLRVAFDRGQHGRIARELARLELRGVPPEHGLVAALGWAHDRVEGGTTHAWAGAADWLARALELRQAPLDDADPRLWPLEGLTEAVDHLADDVRGEAVFPFAEGTRPWDEGAFLDAVEAEDEGLAVQLWRGALSQAGPGFWDQEASALARAALAHYADFGHAAIYTEKARQLDEALAAMGLGATPGAPPVRESLTLPLVRSLCRATREDLLPEFKAYTPVLAGLGRGELLAPWRRSANALDTRGGWPLKGVTEALAWTAAAMLRGEAREAVADRLALANARSLLTFDPAHDQAWRVGPSASSGWLDVTHGLTFTVAALHLVADDEALWDRALLQMACFAGRNAGLAAPGHGAPEEVDAAVARWLPSGDLDAWLTARLVDVGDHGLGRPIRAVHRLKTLTAVRQAAREGLWSEHTQRTAVAGLARWFALPEQAKRVRRTVHQALDLVRREVGESAAAKR